MKGLVLSALLALSCAPTVVPHVYIEPIVDQRPSKRYERQVFDVAGIGWHMTLDSGCKVWTLEQAVHNYSVLMSAACWDSTVNIMGWQGESHAEALGWMLESMTYLPDVEGVKREQLFYGRKGAEIATTRLTYQFVTIFKAMLVIDDIVYVVTCTAQPETCDRQLRGFSARSSAGAVVRIPL